MIFNNLYSLLAEPKLAKSPAQTINFALYKKYLARFATPLNGQDTSKLTELKEHW